MKKHGLLALLLAACSSGAAAPANDAASPPADAPAGLAASCRDLCASGCASSCAADCEAGASAVAACASQYAAVAACNARNGGRCMPSPALAMGACSAEAGAYQSCLSGPPPGDASAPEDAAEDRAPPPGDAAPALTGSCEYTLNTGSRRCAEYYGLSEAATRGAQDVCMTSMVWRDGSWSAGSACDRGMAVGVCRYTSAGNPVVAVYYNDGGFTAEQARDACTRLEGAFQEP